MFEESHCELVLLVLHKDPKQQQILLIREIQAQAHKKHPVLKIKNCSLVKSILLFETEKQLEENK